MDVRSIEDVEPVVEHNGTVPVWWLFKSREMKEITDGGFLDLVNEFGIPPHSNVHFIMTTGIINQGQSALYVNDGKSAESDDRSQIQPCDEQHSK